MSDTKKVRVVVYVDGVEFDSVENDVEAWAVEHVAIAVIAQVDDPDYDGAAEILDASLPPG